jgi:hypothetical protein
VVAEFHVGSDGVDRFWATLRAARNASLASRRHGLRARVAAFTVLREPASAAASMYRYMRTRSNVSRMRSFESFCNHSAALALPQLLRGFDLRSYSSGRRLARANSGAGRALGAHASRGALMQPIALSAEGYLRAASDALRELSWVGVLPHLNRTLQWVCEWAALWPCPPSKTKLVTQRPLTAASTQGGDKTSACPSASIWEERLYEFAERMEAEAARKGAGAGLIEAA